MKIQYIILAIIICVLGWFSSQNDLENTPKHKYTETVSLDSIQDFTFSQGKYLHNEGIVQVEFQLADSMSQREFNAYLCRELEYSKLDQNRYIFVRSKNIVYGEYKSPYHRIKYVCEGSKAYAYVIEFLSTDVSLQEEILIERKIHLLLAKHVIKI